MDKFQVGENYELIEVIGPSSKPSLVSGLKLKTDSHRSRRGRVWSCSFRNPFTYGKESCCEADHSIWTLLVCSKNTPRSQSTFHALSAVPSIYNNNSSTMPTASQALPARKRHQYTWHYHPRKHRRLPGMFVIPLNPPPAKHSNYQI